jgi:hypothetical protein
MTEEVGQSRNGGGQGSLTCTSYYSRITHNWKGGGASDVRLVAGAWDDPTGLKSRIMVAAGGGAGAQVSGGAGGALQGFNGSYYIDSDAGGLGASQLAGGANGGTFGI